MGGAIKDCQSVMHNNNAHALLLIIKWVWFQLAKKWGGHGRFSCPASYTTALVCLGSLIPEPLHAFYLWLLQDFFQTDLCCLYNFYHAFS